METNVQTNLAVELNKKKKNGYYSHGGSGGPHSTHLPLW